MREVLKFWTKYVKLWKGRRELVLDLEPITLKYQYLTNLSGEPYVYLANNENVDKTAKLRGLNSLVHRIGERLSDQEVFGWIGQESVNSNISNLIKIGRRPARTYG